MTGKRWERERAGRVRAERERDEAREALVEAMRIIQAQRLEARKPLEEQTVRIEFPEPLTFGPNDTLNIRVAPKYRTARTIRVKHVGGVRIFTWESES